MKIRFYKYHGTGNDFLILDNRKLRWKPGTALIANLCDRHFGIGADGMLILSSKKGYDFAMTYYNSDGKESTMCGNGGRCMVAFAAKLGIIAGKARFHAIDGDHDAFIIRKNRNDVIVRLKMKDVTVQEADGHHFFLDTGSPHYVVFVKDVTTVDVVPSARKIRNNPRFEKEGTNVDFVQLTGKGLSVRTYERGVENETLSCGTGITAAALAAAMKKPKNDGKFNVRMKGGKLSVSFKQTGNRFTGIWLEGPATFVFEGEINI